MTAHLPDLGVPAHALREWHALTAALDELDGPAPCRVDPATWTDTDLNDPETLEFAVAVCFGCPAVEACRTYGTAAGEVGVWGGEHLQQRAQAIGDAA